MSKPTPRPYRCKCCKEVCIDPDRLPDYFGVYCEECSDAKIKQSKKREGANFYRSWKREDARHGF